jgi:hypothetical protein
MIYIVENGARGERLDHGIGICQASNGKERHQKN